MRKYHHELLEDSRIITFIIREVGIIGGYSYRYGRAVHAKTLTAAKANASKAQAYAGTVLKIKDLDGNLLTYKDSEGKWHDQ